MKTENVSVCRKYVYNWDMKTMWKKKLCLSVIGDCGVSAEKQMELMKKTGFDGFFVIWEPGMDFAALTAKAEELDMVFQSVHAPWNLTADIWRENSEKGEEALLQHKACVDACVISGAPILVVHAFCGFEDHTPTRIGIERFSQVVAYAREKKIKVAFENTEGQEYLDALMDYFAGDDTVGFCWDNGHEMCYNYSRDLLAKYGDRLLCTHLNDNLGIKSYEGKITWIDDLHLLPFDGIADWNDNVKRLKKCGFRDILTFELNTKSKPGRYENDEYFQMPFEQYLAEAYKRACRIAAMLLAEE